MMGVAVIGTGTYLPERVVTNADTNELEKPVVIGSNMSGPGMDVAPMRAPTDLGSSCGPAVMGVDASRQ